MFYFVPETHYHIQDLILELIRLVDAVSSFFYGQQLFHLHEQFLDDAQSRS